MQIYPYENVEKSKLFFRGVTESGVRDTVSEILRAVRDGGDDALRDYARRFDKAELTRDRSPCLGPGRGAGNHRPGTAPCNGAGRGKHPHLPRPPVPHRL